MTSFPLFGLQPEVFLISTTLVSTKLLIGIMPSTFSGFVENVFYFLPLVIIRGSTSQSPKHTLFSVAYGFIYIALCSKIIVHGLNFKSVFNVLSCYKNVFNMDILLRCHWKHLALLPNITYIHFALNLWSCSSLC